MFHSTVFICQKVLELHMLARCLSISGKPRLELHNMGHRPHEVNFEVKCVNCLKHTFECSESFGGLHI